MSAMFDLYAYAKKVLEGEKFAVADGVAMLANGSAEEINFAAEVIFWGIRVSMGAD